MAALLLTAVQPGAAGNGIVFVIVTGGPGRSLGLTSLVGTTATIQLATNGASASLTSFATLANFINSTPSLAALVTAVAIPNVAETDIQTGTYTTSHGATDDQILYVRFQWPNGRYSSNIRIPHNLVYAPYQDVGPSLVSNSGVVLPRPVRIEPVLCLPGSDIGIEVENRASLAQPAFAAMIEFRGRLRRFLKQTG